MYVVAASGLLKTDTLHKFLEKEFNYTDNTLYSTDEFYQNGGSWICGPDGKALNDQILRDEKIILAEIDQEKIIQVRENLDISEHYSRFDIFNKPLKS